MNMYEHKYVSLNPPRAPWTWKNVKAAVGWWIRHEVGFYFTVRENCLLQMTAR